MVPNQSNAAYDRFEQLTPEGLLDFNTKVFAFENLPFEVLHDLLKQFHDFIVASGEVVYTEEMLVEVPGSPEPQVWFRLVDERTERFINYIFPNRTTADEYKNYVAKRNFLAALRTLGIRNVGAYDVAPAPEKAAAA